MSSSAASAYARVATTTASPRDIEAQTLLKAANKLQDAINSADPFNEQTTQALMFNRKLWTIFLTSVTSGDNPLPAEIRQNVANLGLFVMNQTLTVMTNPQRERLPSLININRELAAGLRSAT